MKYILMILFYFNILIPTKYLLMMFQQNRYEISRYHKWNSIKGILKRNYINIVAVIILIILDIKPLFMIMTIFLIIYNLYNVFNKKYLKPLVITNRVKRQIITFFILDFLILFIFSFINITLAIAIGICINELFIYLVAIINNPIEKYFHTKYKNNSKKLLDSYNRLIKIGITGSYGKTTSKNIINQVVSSQYYSLMSPKSYNTPMGISRTINEYLKPLHEVFVCEMGADHVGDIKELVEYVNPKIGIVTSIGPQHLQTFKKLENIINEKMQIIEKLNSDGIGIINIDNEYIRNYVIKNPIKIISVGIDNDADYKASNIKYHNLGSSFDITYNKITYSLNTKLLGKHNIINILLSVACARELDISWENIMRAVNNMD